MTTARTKKRGDGFWPRERDALRPPERITVSEWADRHRTLSPITSSRPGRWETSFTPYLREIMDSISDPEVERVTLLSGTQIGKTEALLNAIGYVIDQDPGPALLVMPREEDATSTAARRIQPMIEESERLRRHMTGQVSDWKQKEMAFNRMVLYLAGANSPADLASRPIRYLFLDEVDKYPMFSGREADPVSLAIERTRTFWDRKILMASTPTTRLGYIWREWEKSDRRRFHVPCPFCGKFQVLEFNEDRVRWPEGERDPVRIRRERLAWYVCAGCGREIPDDPEHKRRMLLGGVWVPEDGEVLPSGEVEAPAGNDHRGYHLNALYSPWLSWSEVAAKFLESKDDVARLLNFVNSWLGHIWEERAEVTEPEKVAALASEYERGTVPDGGKVLVAGVDVQRAMLYYVVRAFGLGEESWLIDCGRVERWEHLQAILFQTAWHRAGREPVRLRLACIDSGYRTDEVYEFCRRVRGIARPVKGQRQLAGIPIRAVRIDRNLRGEVFTGSMQLWHVDTTHFKDKLVRLMGLGEDGRSAWHLHRDPPQEYVRQVAAEHKVLIRNRRTGVASEEWVPRPGGGPNHWLDAEVYALAAAEMLAVYAMREAEEPAPARAPEPDRREGGWLPSRSRESWLPRRRGGWMST